MRGDARRRTRRPGRHDRRGPARPRARRCASRRRRTWSTQRVRACCCAAGIDDWGGVSPLTPDHVNPERPWPRDRGAGRAHRGGRVRAARAADHLPGVRPARRAVAGPAAARARRRAGRPGDRAGRRGRAAGRAALAGARRRASPRSGRTDLHATDRHRRPHRRPARPTSTRSTATGTRSPATQRARSPARGPPHRQRLRTPTSRAGARGCAAGRPGRAARPAHEAPRWRCSSPTAPTLDELARIADALRRDVVGDDVTYVVNRNINFTNVCYIGCRFCAFAQRARDADAYTLSLDEVADRAAEAWAARRHRGVHAGRHRPAAAGHRVLRPRARGEGRASGHARARVLARWRSSTAAAKAGRVDPGVADRAEGGRARLDPRHRRRDPRRRGALGAHQGQAARRAVGRGGHHRARAGHPVVARR